MNPDLIAYAAVIGAAMPGVVAVVNRATWSSRVKAIVALLSCLVAGGATAYLNGDLSGVGVTTACVTVFAAAMGAFHTWWKPSGIAMDIEHATTPASAFLRRE